MRFIEAAYGVADAGCPFTDQQIAHAIVTALPLSQRVLRTVFTTKIPEQTSRRASFHEQRPVCESGETSGTFFVNIKKRKRQEHT